MPNNSRYTLGCSQHQKPWNRWKKWLCLLLVNNLLIILPGSIEQRLLIIKMFNTRHRLCTVSMATCCVFMNLPKHRFEALILLFGVACVFMLFCLFALQVMMALSMNTSAASATQHFAWHWLPFVAPVKARRVGELPASAASTFNNSVTTCTSNTDRVFQIRLHIIWNMMLVQLDHYLSGQ